MAFALFVDLVGLRIRFLLKRVALVGWIHHTMKKKKLPSKLSHLTNLESMRHLSPINPRSRQLFSLVPLSCKFGTQLINTLTTDFQCQNNDHFYWHRMGSNHELPALDCSCLTIVSSLWGPPNDIGTRRVDLGQEFNFLWLHMLFMYNNYLWSNNTYFSIFRQ